jgi:hypothetical protein
MSATDLLNNVQSWMEYFRIRMEMETRCSGSNLLKLAEALDAQFVLGLGQPSQQRGSVDDVPPLIIIEKSVDAPEDPKTDDPQEADVPQTDGPKTDVPQTDDPKTDAPQEADVPQMDDPKMDAPQIEEPKILEIVKELTSAEQPVQA